MCYHIDMARTDIKLGPNAFLSFAVEVAALAVYAWAPFAFLNQSLLVEILLAVGAVVIFSLLWARFAAPNSSTRLGGIGLLLFKVAVFAPALYLILARFGWLVFVIGGAVCILNVVWEYLENREG
jgi:hypothetical protein